MCLQLSTSFPTVSFPSFLILWWRPSRKSLFPSLTSVYYMLTLKPTAQAFDKLQIHIRALRTAAKRTVRSFLRKWSSRLNQTGVGIQVLTTCLIMEKHDFHFHISLRHGLWYATVNFTVLDQAWNTNEKLFEFKNLEQL